MKLLNEKEIEDAANILCNQRFNLSGKIKYGDIYIQGIISGASFTEQKLIPLMVEFTEWVANRYTLSEYGEWCSLGMPTINTTKWLLEQFIDYKSKQNESTEM